MKIMPNKSNYLSAPVGPEVAAFAVVMETRLAMEGYDKAESWEDMAMTKLVNQLMVKAKRLAEADPTNSSEVFNKAVIIGNLAMMVAEKAARMQEKELGYSVETESATVSVSATPSAPAASKAGRSSRSTSPQSDNTPCPNLRTPVHSRLTMQ